MANGQVVQPDREFIRELRQAGGDTVNRCYQCATCSSVCNLSPADKPFPRKEMLLAQWGQREKLARDADIWLCFQCNDCTTRCPRGARPGDVLAAVRTSIYRRFAFPSFMGAALANPRALPMLLLVPALILLGCIFGFAPTSENGEFLFLSSDVIDFNLFLPHSSVDGLFVFGNILIYLFAAIAFLRFWRGLRRPEDARSLSLFSALLRTAGEILSHRRFNQCDVNKPRSIAHMLLLYGFLGAMVTTGAVALVVFLPHYLDLLGWAQWRAFFELPLDLPNPIKTLGALSGLAMLIGSSMMIARRRANRDEVGANGYADYLFLYIIFMVALTGMFSWLTRLVGIPMLAYVTYYLHILGVFFLLWYMPYSKFAHMLYRVMGLVYSTSIDRRPRDMNRIP